MLEIALQCIARGWYVFPCKPRSKEPMVAGGFKAATLDEARVRYWWGNGQWPSANVAIATGASGLTVVDIDHGLKGEGEILALHGFPPTYTVRTGRRPEVGLQLYYVGGGLKSAPWASGGLSGDIRSATGYVMAAGSIHPSGYAYEALTSDANLDFLPDFVRKLGTSVVDVSNLPDAVSDELAQEWKTWLYEYAVFHGLALRDYEKRAVNGWWLGVHCPWESEHTSGAGAESSTVLGILDGRVVFECSHSTCKLKQRNTDVFKATLDHVDGVFECEPGIGPDVILGTGLPVPKTKPDGKKWRDLFHTKDEVINCPPPTFYINQFLQRGSICALAAPVAQRKSIIALNVAHALCTGEKLFGILEVHNKPSRVLYLCPEMGLISMSSRIREIGLTDSIQDTLFITSMNSNTDLQLEDIPVEALEGSVLIVDTAIRFVKGDEQGSNDAKKFSRTLFETQNKQGKDGAVVVLYHSPKATKGAFELTLENCMRGSGEFGAAVTDAHGTRLQEPDKPHESLSFISHIKQRDYAGLKDFEVRCDKNYRMYAVGDPLAPDAVVTLKTKTAGPKADADGKEQAADQLIEKCLRENPHVSADALVIKLDEMGIKRKVTWVRLRSVWKNRADFLSSGSKLTGN